MFKKILFGIGIWMVLNLICMFSCSEKFRTDYGAGINLITIPCAIIITFLYYRVSEQTEEEIEDPALEMEQEETDDQGQDDMIECDDEINDDIESISDPIRQLFVKSYNKSINLWKKRLKMMDRFDEKYPYDYIIEHEEECRSAKKRHDEMMEENAKQIDKLRTNLEIPQNIQSLYKKYMYNLEVEYGQMCVIESQKRIKNDAIQIKLDSIQTDFAYAKIAFNNVWIDNLFEITIGSNNHFYFYPEYVIQSKNLFSNEFTIYQMEDVYVEYTEPEFTERIEKTSSDYEIARYIYIDDNQNAPTIIDKGLECPKKVYGKIRIMPLGIVLFFKNPKEGRKVADAIQGYISSYKRLKRTDSDVSNNHLDDLIGLNLVKEEIATLVNYIKMKQMRDEMSLKTPEVSYHCVFLGNPGTGKTTVARIIADIYRELGILKRGHLVESDRSGLVAEYVGQTAVKTNQMIDKALDGVLFIDEAYTLANESKEDFGHEAIATLLKRMEDDRDRLVVILAGYTNEMEDFINSNPGLRSRFNRYIHFEDYSAEELFKIFLLNAKKNEYTLADDVKDYLLQKLEEVVAKKPKDFGNARYIRNLFEKTVEAQANRLASEPKITKELLVEIKKEDIMCDMRI